MDSVNDSVSKHTGFPHSDIAGYNGSYHLTDAFRRLARPSSPLTARASTTSYDFDFGLSLGAAYSNSDRTDRQVHKGTHNTRDGDRFDATAGGETAEAWTVAHVLPGGQVKSFVCISSRR